jgi:hypothetical protein
MASFSPSILGLGFNSYSLIVVALKYELYSSVLKSTFYLVGSLRQVSRHFSRFCVSLRYWKIWILPKSVHNQILMSYLKCNADSENIGVQSSLSFSGCT